jgi:hypothetical protein
VDAGDNVISPDEVVPVTFDDDANASFDGDYTYIGREGSLPGFVAQGPDGEFYLFSDEAELPNQTFNIDPDAAFPVCFLPGTMIATPDGEVPVEQLAIGDRILTADGRAVAVKWLGRQTVMPIFGMIEGRRPVVITAGALGDGLPVRDLRVTSDHALLIDGVLVHAGALVNGTSIRRISPSELGARFLVYHIAAEDHEVVLAEGAPAETFIDNVSRRRFDNYAEFETLYGTALPSMAELPQPRAMSSRQVPPAIRRRVTEAAARLSNMSKVA